MISCNKIIELLDHQQILSAIEIENRANLAQLEILDVIDSTNTYLLRQAKAGALSGSVCFAEEQTQGRGRLNRSWYSPHGMNIYCSILWRFNKADDISGLSVAIGVIVANTLKKYGLSVQLKWPNDILFAGRKLAGILLESINNNVVIGIGINLNLPKESDAAWISMQEILGYPVARNEFAGLLLNELLMQLPIYQKNNLNPFLKGWHAHDALLNKAITITTSTQLFSGTMKGINEKGELLLENDQCEIMQFCYGEASCKIK